MYKSYVTKQSIEWRYLSVTGYLESLPPTSLLESRVSQFLELGSNRPLVSTPPITVSLLPTTSSSSAASLQANPPSDPTTAEQQADILKQALDLALGSSSEQLPNQMGSLSSINTGLPALPTKLLHRIWANEYIDFAELPPARNKQRALPHYLEGIECSWYKCTSWTALRRLSQTSPHGPSALQCIVLPYCRSNQVEHQT